MSDRLTRIRAAMAEHGLDALMISAPGEENLGADTRYYVAGFTGSAGVILITQTRALFAADFRYVEQATAECVPRGFEVFKWHRAHGAGLPRQRRAVRRTSPDMMVFQRPAMCRSGRSR